MATSAGGFKYRVEKAAGGEWHIWPNGKRYWVPASVAKGTAGPATGSAAAAHPGVLGDDAESIAAKGQALFGRTQSLGQIGTAGEYDSQDLAEALRRLRGQRPEDERTTKEGANRQGLFFSGQLGKRLDDLAADYARREGDLQQSYTRRENARIAARQAIEQGAPLEDAAIMAAAADRQIGRDTTAADAGYLVPNPVQAVAPVKPAVPRAPAAPKVPAIRPPSYRPGPKPRRRVRPVR